MADTGRDERRRCCFRRNVAYVKSIVQVGGIKVGPKLASPVLEQSHCTTPPCVSVPRGCLVQDRLPAVGVFHYRLLVGEEPDICWPVKHRDAPFVTDTTVSQQATTPRDPPVYRIHSLQYVLASTNPDLTRPIPSIMLDNASARPLVSAGCAEHR